MFSTLTRKLKLALTVVMLAMTLAVTLFVTTGVPTASAHETTPARQCYSGLTAFYDWHVYEPTAPWKHHYWLKAPFSSPDMNTRSYTIYYQSENGSMITVSMTEWLHPNYWGVSEQWAWNHPHWSDSWRWQLWYSC